MSVEDFLKTTDHPMKKLLVEAYDLIRSCSPGMTQHIKWNAPSFCHNGDDRITFNLSKKNAVLIIFHRGAKAKKIASKKPILEHHVEILDWPSPDRAVLTIKSTDELREMKSALQQIVNDWIRVAAAYA